MNLKSSAPLLIFLISVTLGAGFILFSALSSEPAAPPAPVVKKAPVPAVPREFGLSLDSFNVTTSTVKRNEFLSNILQRHQIDLSEISMLSQKAKEVFDVRKIAAGNSYAIFTPKVNAGEARAAYFVYQPNPVDYIVYDLRDSMRVYAGKHKVTTRMKTVSGTINSSLYETFEKGGANPALSMQLAQDIYGWVINFYAIKKDDWFKVQYEQSYVKGEPVGTGRIVSAVFSHEGKEYDAYYFRPDSASRGEYYDEEGNSLRRAFLKAPLKFSRISSRYTQRRFHPVQKRWKAHLGTDFAAPSGTPIVATGTGVVTESRYSKYNGNYVKIRHNGTYTTQYLHMSKRAVRRGQHVSQGEVIGYVGSTGLATGPHVCYRFWKNGRQVDALKQHFPPAEPVAEALRPAFERMVASARQVLAGIPMETGEGPEEELAMR
ncbi:murein DD-endopeptidase MepM/ murein hydrolase activator NlpD [Anseongella ginsenosidimutans]|uniref:Murein DD-endopeptidase MepM/ murein hydrolase activator NlpD n=1 Tax=Anseongella ginsenosidimutans TaxID=496056 RepID=A0A4R3KVM2_9SPHI|nr:peptidoglycan DD-metalloendopeptidase family protein [Anseongella ginsenosidimutans]QEC51649.1 peptidoglycan DD-metalloendopeptidase family protein [Anseongella ginsenosidimutans]TCS88984.1 murein DD-endopeptidase MepM/ murein hydrolase activator NlpD [Anseongella ginsenosidimutans]